MNPMFFTETGSSADVSYERYELNAATGVVTFLRLHFIVTVSPGFPSALVIAKTRPEVGTALSETVSFTPITPGMYVTSMLFISSLSSQNDEARSETS